MSLLKTKGRNQEMAGTEPSADVDFGPASSQDSLDYTRGPLVTDWTCPSCGLELLGRERATLTQNFSLFQLIAGGTSWLQDSSTVAPGYLLKP